MQSIRFIAAFAEILFSPAILLYMAVAPIAIADYRRATVSAREWRRVHAS